jgi:hydroxymethylbilane synthase
VIAPPPVAAVKLGTRGSALARAQTERVIELLQSAWPGLACEVTPIVTSGDRSQSNGVPLPAIGGKGLFTAELEEALRAREIDLAVHSLKDLPTEEPDGIVLGAVCLREDARDCLVTREGRTLAQLPAGAVVGTSSLRRAAQLKAVRPDLEVRSIRGNVDTRVRKVREGEYDAALLAAAGIRRLGLEDAVTEWLEPASMLPAPGQGALAVQCRAGDEPVLALLAAIEDPETRSEATAERAFLRALGAGCTAPVGAHATATDPGHVRLQALVASVDGAEVVRVSGEGPAEEVGETLARDVLSAGADRILDVIRAGGPLAGRRIVLTRPRRQAGALASALAARGATVVEVPLVEIAPLEDMSALDAALASIQGYDWIIFTSANGVAAVADRLGARRPPTTRVAAVGPATADAVARLGVEPAFVPDVFAAEEIAAGLGPIAGSRILVPQADIAPSDLAVELRARGAGVEAVAAYRTLPREPTSDEVAEVERGADAIVIASGSAARSLAASPLRDAIGRALLVCIGPKTAAAARAVGLPVGLVADEATAEGIIEALMSHFGKSA